MLSTDSWICQACARTNAAEVPLCPCGEPKMASWDVMFSEHVLEHLADGLVDPLDVLKALHARAVVSYSMLQLHQVARQMRLLTKDTSHFSKALIRARAARMTLDVITHGDTKDKIALMKGAQVLGDVIEHKVDQVTRFVIEGHTGDPPALETESTPPPTPTICAFCDGQGCATCAWGGRPA